MMSDIIFSYDYNNGHESYRCNWYVYDSSWIAEQDKNVSATIAVCCIDDKFVLTKSSKRLKWELPAGRREQGETNLESIIREVQEETLGDIVDPEPVLMINWVGLDDDGVDKFRGVLYVGERKSGDYVYVDDAIDSGIFSFDDMDEFRQTQDDVDVLKKMIDLSLNYGGNTIRKR